MLAGMLGMAPRIAQAATPNTARRLIVFFSPNGTVHNHWRPLGSGSAFSFAPGSILEPLAGLEDQLLILDGLDFASVANHEPGMAAMLTGGGGANTPSAGRSVDQAVAAGLFADDKLPSLELGVQTSAWGATPQTRMCYSGPGQLVPPDDNPANVFKRLFGDVGVDPLVLSKAAIRRNAVTDVLWNELSGLRHKMGASQRIKLEAHLASLAKLETGLANNPAVASCQSPAPPAATPLYGDSHFEGLTDAQIDLMVTAMACGRTRVASLQLSHTVSPLVMNWVPGVTEGHHSLSHKSDSDVAGVASYVAAERWFAGRFRYLLEQLASLPEPGEPEGTMLDHSLVVWASELGDSRLHECKSVPFVLAGGAGGAITPGRYLDFGGQPHQRLLLSICHAMGLALPSFGDPAHGSMPLEGLL